jgi:hypothetical protein
MNGYVENRMKVVGRVQAERRAEAAVVRQADVARRADAACGRVDGQVRWLRRLTGPRGWLTLAERP